MKKSCFFRLRCNISLFKVYKRLVKLKIILFNEGGLEK